MSSGISFLPGAVRTSPDCGLVFLCNCNPTPGLLTELGKFLSGLLWMMHTFSDVVRDDLHPGWYSLPLVFSPETKNSAGFLSYWVLE